MSSYGALSHTTDEPLHVAAGLEWLQGDSYALHTENPPLARAVAAALLFANGARIPDTPNRGQWDPTDVFYASSHPYREALVLARLGTLVSWLVVLLFTWALAGGRTRPWAATCAVILAASYPPLVGHAGLATTDVPFVAAFLAAVIAVRRYRAHRSSMRLMLLSMSLGVLICTKFSALVLFPAAVLAMRGPCAVTAERTLARRSGRTLWCHLLAGVLASAGTIWLCFRFSTGTVADVHAAAGTPFRLERGRLISTLVTLPVPAPEFLHGLLYLDSHRRLGHPSVLFGEFSSHGFLWFYPVALAVKTPVLTGVLIAIGLGVLIKHRLQTGGGSSEDLRFAAAGCAVVGVAMAGSLNLGMRHVLPACPLVFVATGAGLARWVCEGRRPHVRKIVLVLMLCGATGTLLAAAPRQFGYSNLFAGSEPGYSINDSDLDWGQDAFAVEATLKNLGIAEVYWIDRSTTNPCRHDVPELLSLPYGQRPRGWIVVFERPYWLNRGPVRRNPCDPASTTLMPAGWLDWLHERPMTLRIGSAVRLYDVR